MSDKNNLNCDERLITDLFSAIKKCDVQGVKKLLEKGANPNLLDNEGRSTLASAICKNNIDIVKLLIEHEANPNIKELLLGGVTPIMFAISRQADIKIIKMLLDYGANPDTKVSGFNPTFKEAKMYWRKNECWEILKLLYKKSKDTNIVVADKKCECAVTLQYLDGEVIPTIVAREKGDAAKNLCKNAMQHLWSIIKDDALAYGI